MSQKATEKVMRRVKRKRTSSYYKRRRSLRSFADRLHSLEDSKNLRVLSSIAATATDSAHKRAVLLVDEIVYVEDNKVIRKEKGKRPQVIEELSPRKVNKGDILYLKNS